VPSWRCCGSLGRPNGVAAREFRAADTQEEGYPTVQALQYMDKLVAERTGGRHRIQVFHSRQLGEESQTIEQTRVGAIDLNRINVAAIGDVAPVLSILAQPFLFRSIGQLYKVIDGPIGDDILARDRAERLHRAHLLRFRSALHLHQGATGAQPGGSQGPADSRAAVRSGDPDDESARRRTGRDALWAGDDRLVGATGRRSGEQLALLRERRATTGLRNSIR